MDLRTLLSELTGQNLQIGFPYVTDRIFIVLTFVILISIGIFIAFLIRKNRLTKKIKIILLISVLLYNGILFGGVPNVFQAMQLFFSSIFSNENPLLPLMMFLIFLGLTLVFSRIFCGFICPMGIMQELASMLRFKTNFKNYSKGHKRKNYIRWGFFILYLMLTIIWGFQATVFLNPFNGFQFFNYSTNLMLIFAGIFMIGVFITSFFVYRPFCRYFCPFGALACEVSKFSLIKFRRTSNCIDCGLCEKICPTQETFRESNKGECYLCNRCAVICSESNLVDNKLLNQINSRISAIGIQEFDIKKFILNKEDFLKKIIRNLVRSFIINGHSRYYKELVDSFKGPHKFSIDYIQSIIERLKKLMPNEVKKINWNEIEKWKKLNEQKLRDGEKKIVKNKLIYGLNKEI